MCLFADCKLDEIHKNCSCMLDHTFSEDILKKYDCRNDTCMQKVNDIAVCLPKKRGRVLFDMGTGFLDEK